MRRRHFIKIIAGSGLAWPLPAKAQQSDGLRRIGVLFGQADNDQGQARTMALTQALKTLGWVNGRNVQIDVRWGAGNAEEIRRYASELVALNPDVIMASGSPAVVSLLQATNALPIVFVLVPDPVGAGLVDSLAHPGGNATGFTIFEYGIGLLGSCGKWPCNLNPYEPDKLAPPHSITSSARESSAGGTLSPSALAVLRLIANWYFVGACTGSSPGFSPLRMRST